MMKLLKLTATIYIMVLCHATYAQQSKAKVVISAVQPSQADTVRGKWLNSLVLIRSAYKKPGDPAVNDTSKGTAFVLSDHGKLYLVTAKSIITATQYGKNENLPNDAITVGFLHINVGVNIGPNFEYDLDGLSGNDKKHPAVTFTDDEKNIAIISLQKKEYKELAADLLTRGCRPIPVSLLDTGNDHHAGEELKNYGRGQIGMHESMGGGTCYIKDNDPTMPFFTINKIMLQQGTSGSFVVANDKIVGIMTDGTEASTYHAGEPLHWITVSAKFTKPASILACLRKLQQAENDPAFNK